MPSNNHLRLAFAVATRVVCAAFVVVAFFAIPEARNYLEEDVKARGETIYMH